MRFYFVNNPIARRLKGMVRVNTKGDLWDKGVKKENYSKLEHDHVTADVVIIGGGMAGMITAYLLSKTKKKVIVLEKNEIGHGATGLTTAFLTQSIDTDLADMASIFGREKSKQILQSHQKAIDTIEKIITENNIDCDFKRVSNYIYANSEDEIKDLEEEYKAGRELGLQISFPVKTENKYFGFKNFGYLEIKNQGKFHPLKFIYAITNLAKKNGVEIYEQTEVKDFKTAGDSKSHNFHIPAVVYTDKAVVKADWVIVATYEPFNKPLKLYFKKAFYTTYVMGADLKGSKYKEGIYEDLANPYHYIRIDKTKIKGKGKYQFIAGGEDHRSDVHVGPEKNFKALSSYIQKVFPKSSYTVTHKWSGPILEPVDGLPFIGPIDHKNVLYAMAFSGNGMTYSAISAQIFSDIVRGKRNKLLHIYHADRVLALKTLMVKGRDYTGELFHAARNSLKYKK
jgi:glycine/D-amino acid oxidase-like deaminating enzyme